MPAYSELANLLKAMDASTSEEDFESVISPYLINVWLDDYNMSVQECSIVQVSQEQFSYLFDIFPGRLIAAWGISRGKHSGSRPKSRMSGHPLSCGPQYHRGHAIPHTLGGGTDINLVPQLGAINIGAFRILEKEAVAKPGSLYFTYWKYSQQTSQTPIVVEQGLLLPGSLGNIRTHTNI